MPAIAIAIGRHHQRGSRQAINTNVRRTIRRPRFCRLTQSQLIFRITLRSLRRPSLFLHSMYCSISPEAELIEAAISDRRPGDRNSRFSAFNPT
jgi:hypothetical protein